MKNNKKIIKIMVLILLIISVLIIINYSGKRTNKIISEYDYSNLQKIDATVLDVFYRQYSDNYSDNSKIEKIKLSNGKIIEIGIGGGSGDEIGSTVTVYTDGKKYYLTKQAFAIDASNNTILLFISSLIFFVAFMLASIWFGGKGAIFVFVAVLFSLCMTM